MTTEEIIEVFATLRETCDPRGHGVLAALENYCIVNKVALDMVLHAAHADEPSSVVAATQLYSVKA